MSLGVRVSVCSYPSLALSSRDVSLPSSSLYFGQKIHRSSFDTDLKLRCKSNGTRRTKPVSAVIKSSRVPEIDSSSEPIQVFDGSTRLYISYSCPFAQRAWIARNYKGLQDKIELVPIDLKNRPAWYKEKVYPANKVKAFFFFSCAS